MKARFSVQGIWLYDSTKDKIWLSDENVRTLRINTNKKLSVKQVDTRQNNDITNFVSSLFSLSPLTSFFSSLSIYFALFLFLSLLFPPSLFISLPRSISVCHSLMLFLPICHSLSLCASLSAFLLFIFLFPRPLIWIFLLSPSPSFLSLSACFCWISLYLVFSSLFVARHLSFFLSPSHSMYLCACLHFSLHFSPFSFFLVTCSTCPPWCPSFSLLNWRSAKSEYLI